MSKKSQPRRRKTRKQRNQRRDEFDTPLDGLPAGLPDARVMVGLIKQFVSDLLGEDTDWLGDEEDGPLARAQEVMYEAFEESDPRRQVQLAQRALSISPDCSDAYLMLAEYAESAEERLRLNEEAVAAGKRAIGDRFDEAVGHFWGIMHTRPYMRARQELANCLWGMGRHAETIEHYREMLRLNPNDNQGIRHVLMSCLLHEDRDQEAAELLREYGDDGSLEWCFSRALLAFRREGDTSYSRKLLKQAAKANRHAPRMLTGQEDIPGDLPHYDTVGSEEEAICYASANLCHWKATAGAIPWMRDVLRVDRGEPRQAVGPTWNRLQHELIELPQDETEIWHVDLRPLAPAVEEEDLWSLLVTSPSREQVVAMECVPQKPAAQAALALLAKVMLQPQDDDPRRPAVIHVRLQTHADSWRTKLRRIGIECERVSALEDIDQLAEGMADVVSRRQEARKSPPLSDD